MIGLLLICVALAAGNVGAQTRPAEATLTHVEGVVYLDDQTVAAASGESPLRDRATVRTAAGRATVALKRGGLLALDNHTVVRVFANRPYNFNRIDVVSGTAVVISDASSQHVSCASKTWLSSGGVFRFDVQPRTGNVCRLRVFDGAAAVPLISYTSALRAGQSMDLDPACGDMIPTGSFATEELDDFDRWSRQRPRVGG